MPETKEQYQDIDWLPLTKDKQRIYPGKTIYTVEKDYDYHHSGRSVAFFRINKHKAKHFWVGENNEDTEIGVSSYEEFNASECFGEYEEAEKYAQHLTDELAQFGDDYHG